jgi:hypothetical protein
VLLAGRSRHAETLRELEHGRPLHHRAVFEKCDGQVRGVDPGDRQQLACLSVALDVEPPGRNPVPGEEVPQVVGLAREPVPDEPDAAGLERGACLPYRQQVLDDGEEELLGRIPRLEEVVVQRDLVDRRDRRLRVRVGGQEDPLRLRGELPRLDEVLRAGHSRHALVGNQESHLVTTPQQLGEQLERLGAGPGAEDAVALAESHPQVTRDRRENRRFVVDCQDRRSAPACHRLRVRFPLGDHAHGLDSTGCGPQSSPAPCAACETRAAALAIPVRFR